MAAQPDPAVEQKILELTEELEKTKLEKLSLEAEVKGVKEQLEKADSAKASAMAEVAELRTKQTSQMASTALENGHEEGQIEEPVKGGLSDTERLVLEQRILIAEGEAKEQAEKAIKLEEQIETTIKTRSEKMKASLNKRLGELKESQKVQLEAEFRLKLEQEKQIWLADLKTAQVPPQVSTDLPKANNEVVTAPPATPSSPKQNVPSTTVSLNNLSDTQIREIIQNNSLARDIMKGNILQKVATETQKIKDDHAKTVEKAESAKIQAVLMESKKSALRINMFDNKSKLANGKLEVVGRAAQETPQRPVIEVWNEAKEYKLPPPPAAPTPAPETTVKPNGTAIPTLKPLEIKTEAPISQAPPQPSTTPIKANGPSAMPVSGIPIAPQPNPNAVRVSSIPTIRAGAAVRGRGNATYQAPRGAAQGGRGRGSGQGRGGLNASAAVYSPTGSAGQKRPRDEGSMGGSQGNGGKRPRGG